MAAGCGVVLSAWRGRAPLLLTEMLGYGWMAGAAVISLALALGGIFLTGSALVVCVLLCAGILVAAGLRKLWRGVKVKTGLRNARPVQAAAACLALLPIAWVGFHIFRDAFAWDGLSVWEFKARCAFLSGGSLPASFFSDPTRVRLHTSYPLCIPLTQDWYYLIFGKVDQTALRPVILCFFAAAIAILWSGLFRLTRSYWIAGIVSMLPLLSPVLSGDGLGFTQGYCELPLAAAYLAVVAGLWQWQEAGSEGAWNMACLASGLLPWIKQDGAILWAGAMAVALLAHKRQNWKRLVLFAAPGMLTIVGWKLALAVLHAPPEDTFDSFSLNLLVKNLPRLPIIVSALVQECAWTQSWNILWMCLPFAFATLLVRRGRAALIPIAAILCPLCLDLIPYIFTKLPLGFHLGSSLDRLIFQLAPVALLSIGVSMHAPCAKPMEADLRPASAA